MISFLLPLQGSLVVMCVGTCARILGPGLLILGLLSIIANTLLLFPSLEWRYLKEGQITKKAVLMPGLWGGGLLVSGCFSWASFLNFRNSKVLLYFPHSDQVLWSGRDIHKNSVLLLLQKRGFDLLQFLLQ